MIANRELNMDDYLAILRRRLRLILIPALIAPVIGFAISFAFPAKYTSQSLVLVEEQKVPEGYVKPVVTEQVGQRIATMQQQVLSVNRLQPMIERLGLAKGRNMDEAIDEIRQNVLIEAVEPDIASRQSNNPNEKPLPGFYVKYTADNPRDAQTICTELTSMLLEENLKAREQVAQSTTDFLARQVEEAKKNLDDLDSKLAGFKRQYMGQLPGDEDNNMKILMGLNSQLDANTQTLNRAQQDKSYTESLLAQQLAVWKNSQTATNPQTLEQQLAQLQSQLITLQARYTDDYPDVIKTKADIASLKKKIAEVNAASTAGTASVAGDKANLAEPPEIRQLRLQVHQYDEQIAAASREQKQLQSEIRNYQGRMALSPAVEEQYKGLTRDYETAQKFYNDLLTKKSESEMATDMERRQQGEQMRLLNPANLPDTPSFPNRWLFAGGGLGAGLALGLGLTFWMEMRDKSIRTEGDVLAALELPTLVSIPWLASDNGSGYGYGSRLSQPRSAPNQRQETVEVQ